EMSLAKTDRRIAERYLALGDRPDLSALVLDEYDLTKERVLAVTGHRRLLEDRRVLSWAIELRNPYVDALSHLQLRALRAMRATRGISRARKPSGYPCPSKRSWWWRMIGSRPEVERRGFTIDSPIATCACIWGTSIASSGPGLCRIESDTPIFPMSWIMPPRSSVSRASSPSSRRWPRIRADSPTRCVCRSVNEALASNSVASG